MTSSQCVVVVGAGQAGARVCEALRDYGYIGRIVLIGDEAHPPYERPPLSKQVLLGEASIESARVLDPEYYMQHGIELRLGERVGAIDRAAKTVEVEGGGSVAYDHLVLALGVRPRSLPVDAPSDRVMLFRTADDAQMLARRLYPGVRLLIVGGGFLGLEITAAARKLECDVTVAERAASLLPRVVAPEVSSFFYDLHANKGAAIRVGATVVATRLSAAVDRGLEVVAALSDGSSIACDIVLAAVGSIPNTLLAERAGLAVRDGIVVDPRGRTSDPLIWAVGDCARHYNPFLQREVRFESWHNAQHQARVVAANIAGATASYSEIPWFWSDQYEVNLQIVGAPERWDEIVFRGDPSRGRFTAFYLLNGAVVAANTVNNGRDVRPARELIKWSGAVDRDRLSDPSSKLQALIPAAATSRVPAGATDQVTGHRT